MRSKREKLRIPVFEAKTRPWSWSEERLLGKAIPVLPHTIQGPADQDFPVQEVRRSHSPSHAHAGHAGHAAQPQPAGQTPQQKKNAFWMSKRPRRNGRRIVR